LDFLTNKWSLNINLCLLNHNSIVLNKYFFIVSIIIGFTLIFSSCADDKKTSVFQTGQTSKVLITKALADSMAKITAPFIPLTVDSSITTNELIGKFSPAKHPDFVLIKKAYASRQGLYMRKTAYDAFQKMHAAAKKDGVQFTIKSAARNFDYQKGIWEAKWTGKRILSDGTNAAKQISNPEKRALKILEYSSMPGTSRHHWGTDIDVNAFNNEYFEKGQGLKEYEWLVSNAADFGFYQPYTPKNAKRRNGYNEEKWHWSYLPIAKKLTDQYALRITTDAITGFKGAETAKPLDVIAKYVMGINPECL